MKQGFTLIEAAVVGAIIALLGSAIFLTTIAYSKPQSPAEEKERCLRRGETDSTTELPAVCLKYFSK